MSAAHEDDFGPLTARLAEGDEAAFATAYDLFGARLFRTAVRVLGNASEAEDAVQELFVSLVRSRDRLRHVEHLPAYLFVSLRRLLARWSANARRERARQVTEAEPAAATAAAAVPTNELREELDAALAELPAEQREVVVLKLDAELTWQAIGHVLGISPNTAASRYRYALEKLRATLAAREEGRP